jgi:hypothetical protein
LIGQLARTARISLPSPLPKFPFDHTIFLFCPIAKKMWPKPFKICALSRDLLISGLPMEFFVAIYGRIERTRDFSFCCVLNVIYEIQFIIFPLPFSLSIWPSKLILL